MLTACLGATTVGTIPCSLLQDRTKAAPKLCETSGETTVS